MIKFRKLELKEWITLAIVLCTVAFIAGCETAKPYYVAGVGYQLESGDYVDYPGAPQDTSRYVVPIDERCVTGHLALGVELDHGIEVEASHGSCINSKPEINRNEIRVQKRGYFR